MPQPTATASTSLDLLWGAEEIGREIRRSTRQVNHMLATESLPGARKVGGRWCITRAALHALFGASTREAA